MPHIKHLYRGQNVLYHTAEHPGDPCHAVIAHVDHASTMDNNLPRVHLAVLFPNGVWTRRSSVPHADDQEDEVAKKDGRWSEQM